MSDIRKMSHPLPWNRDKGVGVGIDFGYVKQYPGGYHNGIDMYAPAGEPILAALTGRVIFAEHTGGDHGMRVRLDHGDGLVTSYSHLDQIDVEVGDEVEEGHPIGACGHTGTTTGGNSPHLHFMVIVNGEAVDPMDYISPRPAYYSGAYLRWK